MARVQREYWQKRNRFKSLRELADFIFMMILFLAVITAPVIVAIKYIP